MENRRRCILFGCLSLEAQSLLNGLSFFESSNNGAKNDRSHFSFKYIQKSAIQIKKILIFFPYKFKYNDELIERPFFV